MRPEMTCHSMWQWKSQTPVRSWLEIDLSYGWGDLTWVVGLEAHDNVAIGVDDEGITAHRSVREVLIGDLGVCPDTSLFLGPEDSLEGVSVEMERVAARVEVVDDELDNLVLLQDHRVGIAAIDGGVGGVFAGVEDRVQCGNLGAGVGDVVEEGVVLTVAEVVHHDIEGHLVVGLSEEIHLVVGDECHVVKGIEGVDSGSLGLVLGVVVHEPASGVVVEVVGKDIKEGLRE